MQKGLNRQGVSNEREDEYHSFEKPKRSWCAIDLVSGIVYPTMPFVRLLPFGRWKSDQVKANVHSRFVPTTLFSSILHYHLPITCFHQDYSKCRNCQIQLQIRTSTARLAANESPIMILHPNDPFQSSGAASHVSPSHVPTTFDNLSLGNCTRNASFPTSHCLPSLWLWWFIALFFAALGISTIAFMKLMRWYKMHQGKLDVYFDNFDLASERGGRVEAGTSSLRWSEQEGWVDIEQRALLYSPDPRAGTNMAARGWEVDKNSGMLQSCEIAAECLLDKRPSSRLCHDDWSLQSNKLRRSKDFLVRPRREKYLRVNSLP